MPADRLTAEQVQSGFEEMVRRITGATETTNREECDRVERGLMNLSWESLGSGVDILPAPTGERLFRVRWTFATDNLDTSQMRTFKQALKALEPAVQSAVLCGRTAAVMFEKVYEKDEGGNKRITCKATGIFRADQP
jgi:hypothetical protein